MGQPRASPHRCLNALTGQVDSLNTYLVGSKQVITFHARLDQIYAQARRLLQVERSAVTPAVAASDAAVAAYLAAKV